MLIGMVFDEGDREMVLEMVIETVFDLDDRDMVFEMIFDLGDRADALTLNSTTTQKTTHSISYPVRISIIS